MKKTLYITDLDGTLLGVDAKISPKSITMINNMVEDGINFTIATARSLSSVKEYMDQLNLKLPILLYNGGSIYDVAKKKLIKHSVFDGDDILDAINDMKKIGLNPFIHTIDGDNKLHVYYDAVKNVFEKRYLQERMSKETYNRFKIQGIDGDFNDETIYHVCCIDYFDRLNPIKERYLSYENIETTFYSDVYSEGCWWFELAHSDNNKGEGLRWLKKHYDFDEYITFGDNHNDIAMFEEASVSVAVGNAHDVVKEAADIVLEKGKDAVAEYIYQHVNAKN